MKKTAVEKVNNRGVTIVELLIYLGLSTVILLILSQLFVSILDESVETQNYSVVQTDGRYIMARLRYQINNADSITTPANLGDSSHELTVITDGTSYHYSVDSNNKLYMNDGVGNYLISNPDSELTDLSFVRTGNIGGKPVINIIFTVSIGVNGTAQFESQTFKGAGGLR